MTNERSIELEIEVAGTPDQVWNAIATGPGISSWYVPHTVEERDGGAMTATFGPGMEVAGRVAAWEPPSRVLFDGGESGVGLAFEWLVEATDRGTCVVRLVNSGFGSGEEWDGQYDAMTDGWAIFLCNLKVHLDHFGGQTAVASLPMATWSERRDDAWARLVDAIGVDSEIAVGDRLEVGGPAEGGPSISGVVVDLTPWRLSLVLDGPGQGSGFLAVEGQGDQVEVSMWAYFYGDDAEAVAATHTNDWATLFARVGPEAN